MNKAILLEKLGSGRQQTLDTINKLPKPALLEPGVIGDWSVKDILHHLSHWEAELVTLLWWVQQGRKPSITSHSVEEIEMLNQQWYQEGCERSIELVLADFHGVRKQTIRRVEAITDEDLTNQDRFLWLKGISLAQKIAAYSIDHEEEHLNQIFEWQSMHYA